MRFIDINSLKEGMVLARDVRILSAQNNEASLLKVGTVLTAINILRLKGIGSSGLFVHDEDYNHNADTVAYSNNIISKELKKEAISQIEKLFDSVDENPTQADDKVIGSVNDLSFKIVNNILDNSNFMVNIVDLKMFDDYTYHHSLSVAVLAASIGVAMGLEKKDLYELGLSALLHDIGKTEVPYGLISKDSKLSDVEFEIIKTHALKGAKYVENSSFVTDAIYKGIVGHHEKQDGTGYPYGLKGDEIHLFAKIISVADVYDALTSNRPYRTPASPSETVEYIMGGNGTMFDPEVVKAFFGRVSPYPLNEYVQLSNGKTAIVTKVYAQNPLRPKVKVIHERDLEYDLFQDPSCLSITISHLV